LPTAAKVTKSAAGDRQLVMPSLPKPTMLGELTWSFIDFDKG
jgi:hypothetical protein